MLKILLSKIWKFVHYWILQLLISRIFPGLLLLILSLWLAGVSHFSPALPQFMRVPIAIVILALYLLICISRQRRVISLALWLGVALAVLGLYLNLRPSNDRHWEASVARTPRAEVKGNIVKLHNIRHFNYRSETDFDRHYYTQSFNIDQVVSVDLLVSYWSSRHIAHVMTSFGFADGKFLNISVETRREQNEQYSPLAGFFRNYELIYVLSDERDVIGLRTKVRQPNEQVYLLRLATSKKKAGLLFKEFLKEIIRLETKPDFYDTLLTNCTTQVFWHSHVNNPLLRFNWKVLLSGHVPEYLYDGGALDQTLSFEQLMQKSLVNEVANQSLGQTNFSELIRQHVPRPKQYD